MDVSSWWRTYISVFRNWSRGRLFESGQAEGLIGALEGKLMLIEGLLECLTSGRGRLRLWRMD